MRPRNKSHGGSQLMSTGSRCALVVLPFVLTNVLGVYAQLRPDVDTSHEAPPAPKAAQIIIQTSPNAHVYLDDVLKGQANAEGRLVIENPKPGEHTLRISLTGRRNHEQKVTVTAGQVEKITAVLAELEGTVEVKTASGAAVFVDGMNRGTTDAAGSLSLPDVAAGAHELRISAVGKKDFQGKFSVAAGQEVKVEAALEDLPGTVAVETSPGARVFLDNANQGTTDAQGKLSVPEVVAGAHELRITAPGKKQFRKNIYVPGGQQAWIEARLENAGPPPPGTVRVNPKDGLKYAWIPPGSFPMGCSPGDSECAGDEKPSHQVTLTRGFWAGQTEVTVGAYKRFAAATGQPLPPAPAFNGDWGNDQMPIVTVTWDEALQYCTWAGARLLTEAEWEYAARGGSAAARYGPLEDVAWYDANSGGQTHPVGAKQANALGLFDVLGNILEWVNDWYGEKYYASGPLRDPPGPGRGNKRVFRGGNFLLKAKAARVSSRDSGVPGDRFRGTGIRCGGAVFVP